MPASFFDNLRKLYGYGPKATPADRLGGRNTPHGRIDDAIRTVRRDQLGTGAHAEYRWVGVSSSNVHSIRYVPHLTVDESSREMVPIPGYGGHPEDAYELVHDTKEADEGTLYITFRKKLNSAELGDTFEYDDFPEPSYIEFLTAGSKGHYVQTEIRGGLYPDGCGRYRRVDRAAASR